MNLKVSGAKMVVRKSNHDEDLPLVDRVLAGDKEAFEELVQRNERRVYRVTLAVTGNAEDAEEAMQDTFLRAYQHLGGFQRASRFSTWLTRIAVNEGLQLRRRRRNVRSLDELMISEEEKLPRQLQDWHDDPEKLYAKEEMRQIVEKAIQSLPPIYREVFVLRDVEGLSTKEAAETLGLGVSAVKTRLLRARLMMREVLAARFQRPSTLRSRIRRAGWMIRQALGTHSGREEGN